VPTKSDKKKIGRKPSTGSENPELNRKGGPQNTSSWFEGRQCVHHFSGWCTKGAEEYTWKQQKDIFLGRLEKKKTTSVKGGVKVLIPGESIYRPNE